MSFIPFFFSYFWTAFGLFLPETGGAAALTSDAARERRGNNSTLTCWQTDALGQLRWGSIRKALSEERRPAWGSPRSLGGCGSRPSLLPGLILPPLSLYCISISLNPSSPCSLSCSALPPPSSFYAKKLFFLISPCALLFLSLQSWHYITRLHRRAS